MEEIEVECPVCKKKHRLKKRVDVFYCKNTPLALIKDRKGWRLVEIKIISEREDVKLDKIWR